VEFILKDAVVKKVIAKKNIVNVFKLKFHAVINVHVLIAKTNLHIHMV
jgi:hypothetical protein